MRVKHTYFKFKKVLAYLGSTKLSYVPSKNECACFYIMKKKIPVLVDTTRRCFVIPMIQGDLNSNISINTFYKIDQKNKQIIYQIFEKNYTVTRLHEEINNISFDTVENFDINPKKYQSGFILSILSSQEKVPNASILVFENTYLCLYMNHCKHSIPDYKV